MLNYIWSGLLIISISFALTHDLADEWNNNHDNGVTVQIPFSYTNHHTSINLHYLNQTLPAQWKSDNHSELTIPVTDTLPSQWTKHRIKPGDSHLFVTVTSINSDRQTISFLLPEVHWVKMQAISESAFDMAKFAVTLAIGLAGIMGLWLGLMRIAEKSGLIFIFIKAIRPLLGWLFPEIPRNHPALGSISLNLAANILGLGNAATPLGIRAMQQLQELNDKKDQASNSMCMFLALNTSSVQLLPPVTLIAIMGTQVSEFIIPIILATTASTLAAVLSAKIYARRIK